MSRRENSCYAALALLICIIGLATLASCTERLARYTEPSYGVKIKYAVRQPIKFPDFTIEFVEQKPPRFYERYPRQEFRITGAGKVQEVSWGRDRGDVGRVKFKVGDDNYIMELIGSQKYGALGENVMVIWKNSEGF
jgi:hypothetical protein